MSVKGHVINHDEAFIFSNVIFGVVFGLTGLISCPIIPGHGLQPTNGSILLWGMASMCVLNLGVRLFLALVSHEKYLE